MSSSRDKSGSKRHRSSEQEDGEDRVESKGFQIKRPHVTKSSEQYFTLGLKPGYPGTFKGNHLAIVNGQEQFFSEYEVKVDGDCGFTALGVSREQAVDSLKKMKNVDKRRIVVKELINAIDNFNKSNGEEIDPTLYMEPSIREKVRRLHESLNAKSNAIQISCDAIRKKLSESNTILSSEGNTNEIILLNLNNLPLTEKYKSELSNLKERYDNQLNEILNDEEIFNAYINSYQRTDSRQGLWLGVNSMHCIAEEKRIALRVWGLDTEGTIRLNSSHNPAEPTGVVNILIRGGHYTFLVEGREEAPSLEKNLPGKSSKPSKKPILISVFNQKGGVGKTTASLNIGFMLAKEFNKRILLVDTDSQCNLTRMVLDEKEYNQFFNQHENEAKEGDDLITMLDCFGPLINREEPIQISRADRVKISPVKDYSNLYYIPGHLSLSDIDMPIALGMSKAHGAKTYPALVTNFFRRVGENNNIDIILFDLSPSIVGLNPSVIMGSDYWFSPFFTDSLSKQAMKNLQKKLPQWKNHEAFRYLREKSKEDPWHIAANPYFLGAFPHKVKYYKSGDEDEPVYLAQASYGAGIMEVYKEVEKLQNILREHGMLSQGFEFNSADYGNGIRDFAGLGLDAQREARPICDIDYDFPHPQIELIKEGEYREKKPKSMQNHSRIIQEQVYLGYLKIICLLFRNLKSEDMAILGANFRKKIFDNLGKVDPLASIESHPFVQDKQNKLTNLFCRWEKEQDCIDVSSEVDDSKGQRDEALEKYARDYGYCIHEDKATDKTSSFFTSIANELKKLGQNVDPQTLRQLIAKEYDKHQEDYKQFLPENERKKHASEISPKGVWFGKIVCHAIARIKKVVVVILSPTTEPQVIKPAGATQVIVIGRNTASHLQLLVPVNLRLDSGEPTKQLSKIIQDAPVLGKYSQSVEEEGEAEEIFEHQSSSSTQSTSKKKSLANSFVASIGRLSTASSVHRQPAASRTQTSSSSSQNQNVPVRLSFIAGMSASSSNSSVGRSTQSSSVLPSSQAREPAPKK